MAASYYGSFLIWQVRVFAPRLGVYKGVLATRRGIERIQLSPSMRKVGPSDAARPGSWATLLITKLGIFQAHTQCTAHTARLLPSVRC